MDDPTKYKSPVLVRQATYDFASFAKRKVAEVGEPGFANEQSPPVPVRQAAVARLRHATLGGAGTRANESGFANEQRQGMA